MVLQVATTWKCASELQSGCVHSQKAQIGQCRAALGGTNLVGVNVNPNDVEVASFRDSLGRGSDTATYLEIALSGLHCATFEQLPSTASNPGPVPRAVDEKLFRRSHFHGFPPVRSMGLPRSQKSRAALNVDGPLRTF